MGDFELRDGTRDDLPALIRQDSATFGLTYTPGHIEDVLGPGGFLDPADFVIAEDARDGRMIGVAAEYRLNFATPGARAVDLCGIGWVSVLPTHRRRGVLRAMMEHKLRAAHDAGLAGAALVASEAPIYGRYGFGPATVKRSITIPRRRAVLRDPVDTRSVRLVGPDEARALMPAIHERYRRQIPAGIARDPARWNVIIGDRPERRNGLTELFHLVHPDGYVSYRAEHGFVGGEFALTCHITEYAAVTDEAHSALWGTLLGLDLYTTITGMMLPPDDPIAFKLTDLRQVTTTGLTDGVWVRPLHVPELVAARTYAVEFDLVWELRDPLFGDARYRIAGGPEGGSAARTDASPDLVSGIDALGAVFFGGTRLQSLAASGQVAATDPATLRRGDRAFLADRAPFHGTFF